jgi:hypothetical protein
VVGRPKCGSMPRSLRNMFANIISTDYAYDDATSAKAGNIAGHITGASDHQLASRYRQDRRGRLGRDAGDFAIDEIVEHQIPDAEHGLLGNELKRLFEIEHQVRTPQPYYRTNRLFAALTQSFAIRRLQDPISAG